MALNDNVIDQDVELKGSLTIPLKTGGKIVLSPNGIQLVGTKAAVKTPKLAITEEGIMGYDTQGSLMVRWNASTGELETFGGSALAPSGLLVFAVANGLDIVSEVVPTVNTKDLEIGEFRAVFYPLGSKYPSYVDLRTYNEGGTFQHDGSTMIHAGCLPTVSFGCSYQFTSAAHGRWYYAWRIKNKNGWSQWSDGNPLPIKVYDYVDTTQGSDSGPPADWDVYLQAANKTDHYHVRVGRANTNGEVIQGVAFQIKDADVGAWRAVDENAGESVVLYDGSGANHTLSHGGCRITLDSGNGFGNANVGDAIILDRRGANNFNTEHCLWNKVAYIDTAGRFIETAWPYTLNQATPDYRCKICTWPRSWNNSDGYLGEEPGEGWSEVVFPGGDRDTQEFVSEAMYVPSAVTNPEGRAYFTNGYSTSDNNKTHSTGLYTGGGSSGNNNNAAGNNTSWNNFQNAEDWIFLRGDPNRIAVTWDNNGCPLLEGNMDWSTNNYSVDVTACLAHGRFYPDPSTGNLIVSASFENYTPPQDVPDYNERWIAGLIMMYEPIYFTAPWQTIYWGMGRVSSANAVTTKLTASYFGTTAVKPDGMPELNTPAGMNWNTADIGNNQNFTITLYFQPGLNYYINAGFGLNHFTFNKTWDAGNNEVGDNMYTSTLGMSPRGPARGFRFAVGVFPGIASNSARVKPVSFTLVEGQFYPFTTAGGGGGVDVFSQIVTPTPPGPTIFKIRS